MIVKNFLIYCFIIFFVAILNQKCFAQKFVPKEISYSPERTIEIKVGEFNLIAEWRLEDDNYFESICIETSDFNRIKSIVDNTTNWCYLKSDSRDNLIISQQNTIQELDTEILDLKEQLTFENKIFKYTFLSSATIILGLTIIILLK